MNRECYALEPDVVSVFPLGSNTDIIIRKNIQKATHEDDGGAKEVWECDEVQLRVAGIVTREQVLADPDYWWNYKEREPIAAEPEQRIAKIEADIDYIAMMCDVVL